MHYIYYKGEEIKMVSEKKLKKADNLSYIKKKLTDEEKVKIFDNKNKRKVIEEKLIITEPVVEESLEDRIKVIEDSIKEAKLNFNK